MGQLFDQIDQALEEFIRAQKMFFVATAPLDGAGHINLSPKGLDTLRVLDAQTVAYLDYVGSGAETIAQLRENGRIVLMLCAFQGAPRIVRLHGRGSVFEPQDQEFNRLRGLFPAEPVGRAIVHISINRIADSCGYGVPLYTFEGNRSQLPDWTARKGPQGLHEYQAQKNRISIDGLQALRGPHRRANPDESGWLTREWSRRDPPVLSEHGRGARLIRNRWADRKFDEMAQHFEFRVARVMANRTATTSLLVVAAMIAGAISVVPQAPVLAITGVSVIDVVDGRIVPNSTVVIRGAAIASVTPGGTIPAGARVVDGQGKFLIPGLWDMHAHMEMVGESWLQLYVANGVTGIRDMGSDLDLILNLRDGTASGRILGPRIFAAGPILDDAPGDWPFRMRVKTAADGRAAVQLLKRRGVDLIKVHDHTPPEAFFAIADEARRLNLPVAGHIPIGLTAEQVVDAGQRDIEHLSNLALWRPCSGDQKYSPEACRLFFAMLARRGVWSTPTLAAMSELLTIGTPASAVSADHMAYANKSLRAMWAGNQSISTPGAAQFLRANAEVGAVVTKDMANAGVAILAGCDSMIAGFCVHDELGAMVRGGMTPLAALQTATLNPPRYFGLQQAAGTIASGQRADLVMLDANPLTDVSNVGRIRAVVLAGMFLGRQELDTLLARAKTAAMQQ